MSTINKHTEKVNAEMYDRFRTQYIIAVLESLYDRQRISEDMFLCARALALTKGNRK